MDPMPVRNHNYCWGVDFQSETLNLVGNIVVMMLLLWNKMGLLLNSHKGVTSNNIFHFFISESCDGGVSYAHNTWLLIFEMYLRCNQLQALLFTNSYSYKYLSKSLEAEHKISIILNYSPVKKTSENFWHERFSMQIQKVASQLYQVEFPPCFPLMMVNFSFSNFLINFELIKLIWGNPHDPSPLAIATPLFLKL